MDDDKKRQIAAQSWKRGNDSVTKEDFKFAVEMYGQSVKLCPDNVLYRQSLRAAQCKLYNDNKTGKGGLFTKGTLTKIRASTKTARMRSRWDDLDKAAEEGLAINPWDAYFNADVGEACYQRGFLDVAAEAFKRAANLDTNEVDFLRSYASVQEDRGNNVEASNIWARIYSLDPTDGEARKRSQDNITKDTMKDGYDDAESTRDVGKEPRSAYDEDRPIGRQPEVKEELTDEEQAQRAIRKDEASVEARMKLAELYRKQKDWTKAVEAFQAALEVSGGDHNVREQLEECEIEILRNNFDIARRRAAEQPDPKSKSTRDKIETELVLREMEMLRTRIERYPNDAKYKFELGTRYVRFKKFKEAIPYLQQSVNDKRNQGHALRLLGKCFLGVKNEGIAQRQFAKAAEVTSPIDDPIDYCECHYFLGLIAQNKGDKAAAENHYNEILSINYEYKDVQARLDRLDDDGASDD